MRVFPAARLLVATLAVTAAIGIVSVASAATTPLRRVDWQRVITTDPRFTVDTSIPEPFASIGPFISFSAASGMAVYNDALEPTDEGFGHADLADIVYTDLDGDGAEEAVIPLQSGGTAGTVGLLLYHEADGAPRLVLAVVGNKLGVSGRDGTLVLIRPQYAGFEPNCCPSGVLTDRLILAGDSLLVVSEDEQAYPGAQVITVQAFYQYLNDGSYADA
jgi:hypothetical protein